MKYDIRYDLLADESILWEGQPDIKKRFTFQDGYNFIFAIIWTSFSITWEYIAFKSGAPLPFLLFGVPFVLIGFYMLFGSYFYTRYVKRNTYYYLTNKRVIIQKRTKNISVRAEFIEKIEGLSKRYNRKGLGTVKFSEGDYYQEVNSSRRIRTYKVNQFGFFDIDENDVDRVYKIINEIKNGIQY